MSYLDTGFDMIHYFFEQTSPIEIPERLSPWIEELIRNEGKKPGEITYILCDDEYLLKVNQDYLQHDYYTDVITFDYVKGKTISGDIFVSLQRIKDNAETLSADVERELKRVLAHGVLHLCGYKDKTIEDAKKMREKEEFYLNLY